MPPGRGFRTFRVHKAKPVQGLYLQNSAERPARKLCIRCNSQIACPFFGHGRGRVQEGTLGPVMNVGHITDLQGGHYPRSWLIFFSRMQVGRLGCNSRGKLQPEDTGKLCRGVLAKAKPRDRLGSSNHRRRRRFSICSTYLIEPASLVIERMLHPVHRMFCAVARMLCAGHRMLHRMALSGRGNLPQLRRRRFSGT
jgi:hypothetical protein